MTKKDRAVYEDVEVLRKHLKALNNKKFRLDCGHHVTIGHFLGNDLVVYNGKDLKIVCLDCGS